MHPEPRQQAKVSAQLYGQAASSGGRATVTRRIRAHGGHHSQPECLTEYKIMSILLLPESKLDSSVTQPTD